MNFQSAQRHIIFPVCCTDNSRSQDKLIRFCVDTNLGYLPLCCNYNAVLCAQENTYKDFMLDAKQYLAFGK